MAARNAELSANRKKARRPQSETATTHAWKVNLAARQHRRQPYCDSEVIRTDRMNCEGGDDDQSHCRNELLQCTTRYYTGARRERRVFFGCLHGFGCACNMATK
jgi:hypothetical protein